MSSAALQSAPLQSTSVSSNSPVVALSSGRPYTSGSSQSREPFYSQTSPNASPSSRRPVRRPSGNGATASSISHPYYSSSGASPTSVSAPMAHRATSSPSPTKTTTPSGHHMMAPGDSQRGLPPVVAARTSSSRAPAATAAMTSDRISRRTAHPEASTSPRQISGIDGQQDRGDKQRANDNATYTNGGSDDPSLAAAARSRRRQMAAGEPVIHRPSNSSDRRATASASAIQRQAMAAAGNRTPTGSSRETGEVMSRVVTSSPGVDIQREQERMAEAIPSSPLSPATPSGLSAVGSEGFDDGARGTRSRHDHVANAGKREKSIKFGEYFLGGTLGEGEFGKVKMGWKQEGGVQVAIKFIRRDSVGTNPSRLAKIYREIAILREISHPNIVRLHEMVETDKQIGIILEYASGGELFDYILNHRYLKDNAARRLFAQLVSGVGYLHKKGIVHRDLKLENLLLDRNRNIIITDFGFANTFNPGDELGEDIEYNLTSRDFVKRMELDKILADGHRRGDLMQTSCGSPCYAAPELVVSDSLYTGRKVDVWSCGVILYAMLAGYLPFDDDPANPEGDNINLLYKYIVSTPLTFPEYVTPHARDLLRRILVPDPRKRADLFEVARHSWLSEYAHVVGFITSSTTTTQDISSATVPSEERQDGPLLARSASVREPSKTQKANTAVGDLARKHGNVDQDAAEAHPKTTKDNKRRTVQVEYVAPRSETQRGSSTAAAAQPRTRTHARTGSQGSVEVSSQSARGVEKPLPQHPPTDQHANHSRKQPTSNPKQSMGPPARWELPPARPVSDTAHLATHIPPPVSIARPTTGGSITSTGSRSGSMHLTSRGSYSQPAAPTLAGTNAQGRMSQPKGGKNYNIPNVKDDSDFGRPSFTGHPTAKPSRGAGLSDGSDQPEHKSAKGHKRSNTIGGFFSRTNSVFAVKRGPDEKLLTKKYPPVSLSSGMARDQSPRQSIDSRRSIPFGFAKKRSGSIANSQTTTLLEKPRRFSLLPVGLSLKTIGIGKDGTSAQVQYQDRSEEYHDPPQTAPARTDETQNLSHAIASYTSTDGSYDHNQNIPRKDSSNITQYRENPTVPDSRGQKQLLSPLNFGADQQNEPQSILAAVNHRDYASDPRRHIQMPSSTQSGRGGTSRGVLQKNNRRFADAYEPELGNGYGVPHRDHAGTSGAARKVMDFFRRRGRERGL